MAFIFPGMDGGNPRHLVDTKVIWPNGLTIDYTTDRIFWGDAGTDRIEFVESDGSNRYNSSEILKFYGVLCSENSGLWFSWSEILFYKSLQIRSHSLKLVALQSHNSVYGT